MRNRECAPILSKFGNLFASTWLYYPSEESCGSFVYKQLVDLASKPRSSDNKKKQAAPLASEQCRREIESKLNQGVPGKEGREDLRASGPALQIVEESSLRKKPRRSKTAIGSKDPYLSASTRQGA